MPDVRLPDSVKIADRGNRSWLSVVAPLLLISYVLGGLLVPALRGNATEQTVFPTERLSATMAIATLIVLAMEVVRRAGSLSQRGLGSPVWRLLAVSMSGLVLALSFAAATVRLHPLLAMVVSVAAAAVCLACASGALSVPESRAASLLLVAMSFSSLARTFGWQLAFLSGERADRVLFSLSSYALSASTLLEAFGQIIAIAWLGTRGPWRGRLLTNLAVIVAFGGTWVAARALHSPSESIPMRVFAFAVARVLNGYVPLSPLAAFLGLCAPLLALVALVQSSRAMPYAAAIALLLCSRGAFDVPLAALGSVVAALVLFDTRLCHLSAPSLEPSAATTPTTQGDHE